MVKKCCIDGCQKPESGIELTYFKFPKKPAYKQKWLKAIQSSQKITANSLVCSYHFLEADYKLVHGKKTLKATVVPTVFKNDSKIITKEILEIPVRRTRSSKLAVPKVSNDDDKSSDSDQADESSDGADDKKIESKTKNALKKAKQDGLDNGVIENDVKDGDDELSDCTKDCASTIDDLLACLNGDIQEKSIPPDETINLTSESTKKSASNLDSETESIPDTKNQASNPSTEESYSDPLAKKQVTTNVFENLDYEDLIQESHVKTTELRGVVVDTIGACEPRDDSDTANWFDFNITKDLMEPEPVFISIPVDPVLASTYSPGSPECLPSPECPVEMQVDVDPALLGDSDPDPEPDPEPDDDDDDVQVIERPNEPVSLLTSSDEDDVIIEEPKIDTVEVSDETDEDDLPLTRYLKTKEGLDEFEKNLKSLFWGTTKEYFCYTCSFVSQTKTGLREHMKIHAKTSQIMVCQVCDFQSPSKAQFARHKRKHKEERRYKCHLCDYRARHKMSLVYHMKSHSDTDKSVYHKCKMCSYKTDNRLQMHKHLKSKHQVKIYMCKTCNYSTKRQSDLNRHTKVRHSVPPANDDEYVPGKDV